MSRSASLALQISISIIVTLLLLFLAPTPIGILMIVILLFAINDFVNRRRRLAIDSFNRLLHDVAKNGGSIENVASAFSRSGSLKYECAQFFHRLRAGQEPLQAAEASDLPLSFSTAVVMTTAASGQKSPHSLDQDSATRMDNDYREGIPVYGQFIYLIGSLLMLLFVLMFFHLFITPTIGKMLEEFGIEDRYAWLMKSMGSSWLVFGIVGLGGFLISLLVLRIFFPTRNFFSPKQADRRASILRGFAEAIEVGIPYSRAVEIGHAVSLRAAQRSRMREASYRLERGQSFASTMNRVGWLSEREANWIENASPKRTTELLRLIADETVRDASANLRWLMGIFYPVAILLLGASVMAYGFAFFHSLNSLILGLT